MSENQPLIRNRLTNREWTHPDVRRLSEEEFKMFGQEFTEILSISIEIDATGNPYLASDKAIELYDAIRVLDRVLLLDGAAIYNGPHEQSMLALEAATNRSSETIPKPSLKCNTPGCGNSCINRSHTIQRKNVLERLVCEKNRVICIKPDLFSKDVLKEVGWKDASTFPGFCEDCETQVFQKSERRDSILTLETAMPLIWRAGLFTRYRRAQELRARAVTVSSKRLCNLVKLSGQHLLLLLHVALLKQNMCKYRRCRAAPDMLASDLFEGTREHRYAVWEIEEPPFAGGGSFQVMVDINGNPVCDSSQYTAMPDNITFTTARFDGTSYLIFAWNNGSSVADKLVKDLMKLDADVQSDYILQIVFGSSDALYISPSWWNIRSSPAERSLVLDYITMPFALMEKSQSVTGIREAKVLQSFYLA